MSGRDREERAITAIACSSDLRAATTAPVFA